MVAKSSIASDIIWNYAFQALATCEKVDLSTLIGLVKLAPVISGDTRERIALRILESLFDDGDEATVGSDSTKNPKISFDASERCEDVLKKILHETPEQMTKLKKEKWEILSFLTHKKSSLPKSLLQKLKEEILESRNPLLASLKEKAFSNVPPVDPPKNVVHMNYEKADDERTDMAAKKEAFLKSQCTTSQDFLDVTELSEIDPCMKCNEGGQLLVCSSDACQVKVHESCLGLSVTFDENGEFFCLFCAHSLATSKYLEAKQKVLLTRKNLQAFSSFEVKHRLNKSSMKQSELEKNEGKQMGGVCETTVEAHGNENITNRANNINCMSSNRGDSAPPDPLISVVNDQSVKKTTDLPQNPIPKPTIPKQKCKENENQKSTESNFSRRLRKRKAYTPPPPVPLRRRILVWTTVEEETLKEGVERYAGANKGIPWKQILDFGHDIFHKGRTTIDLKDKWRNMCKAKGTPSAKEFHGS